MIGIRLDKAKSYFRETVVAQAAGKANVKALAKFGSFVRRTAKSSIKPAGKKRKVSLPGEPPRSITGLLKKPLFFIVEPREQNVVIGPILANNKATAKNDGTVPETLEHGGRVTYPARGNRKRRTVKVAPRPYMGPAMEKEKPQWAKLWADSVK